ncbi:MULTISPECIES: YecA family protein [Acidithiobacillus]|uniref:SEC-C domain-containing protein n=2 Tax=Acidithiobacillus TaxID=119977 RepID=A0A179BIJ5_ACIFR|nr:MULTISPECIES: SEC-C metal-binding domain-containing protein [Acidithiobacillus]MEB8487569.1 SEC-C metal-binding domain-containing protein [Acidithiobacillus ferriphilus]MEB8490344.1 SEC-C metal-binding domain-containing protein [Acidithiobacillus ferriphilus]MEB8492320.1 SEC-C metal-binding domain-containing protein [Acidithiobacillus ferriphilus]MEB8512667.1 SEC-C metal-binding domain-containing protein [Acidithiobacillus ferriphilus]MEB8522156.1 SEC-C metal-binding domain-containing prote
MFVFFDRESELPEAPDKDPQVLWDRWKRNVIDRQINTAHGAERYIRSGRKIFLDAKRETPLPVPFDQDKAVIHKIIVSHGAKEACERASPQNIYGSLAITYTEADGGTTHPFHIEIDKRKPIHVLDSHNMPIVLQELDTVSDFSAYLDEKVRATTAFDYLGYCGEEDLLGHYLLNYDSATKRHVIGPKGKDTSKVNGVMIGEGEWHDFVQTDLYKNTKNEDRSSYFWDKLIQRTCQNSLDGTLGGNSNIVRGESAIYEMVKEPRFMRRGLSEKMLSAVERFPDTGSFTRQVTFLPSFEPNVGYVLLQLRAPEEFRATPDYREKRQTLLEIACGAAKNKFPNLVKIIGIGIEAPKFSDGTVAEDFILMPCEKWPDEMKIYYEELNREWNFFGTPELRQFNDRVTQFVPPPRPASLAKPGKIGRNDPCPCGSGKKYKKCHG